MGNNRRINHRWSFSRTPRRIRLQKAALPHPDDNRCVVNYRFKYQNHIFGFAVREIDSLQGGNLPTPRSPAAGVCRSCGSALEMPGDYCLSCGSSQTKLLGCLLRSEGATLLMLDAEGRELSTDFVKSYLHLYERDSIEYQISLRNFLELVVDRIHRKRPTSFGLFL